MSYAWRNDSCFPGEEKLAGDMGMNRTRVGEFVSELRNRGLISIKRRGLSKTNIYTIHLRAEKPETLRLRKPGFTDRIPDVD